MQGTKESLKRVISPTPSQALEYYNALKVFQSGFNYESGLYDDEIQQAILRVEEIREYFLTRFSKIDLQK